MKTGLDHLPDGNQRDTAEELDGITVRVTLLRHHSTSLLTGAKMKRIHSASPVERVEM